MSRGNKSTRSDGRKHPVEKSGFTEFHETPDIVLRAKFNAARSRLDGFSNVRNCNEQITEMTKRLDILYNEKTCFRKIFHFDLGY